MKQDIIILRSWNRMYMKKMKTVIHQS